MPLSPSSYVAVLKCTHENVSGARNHLYNPSLYQTEQRGDQLLQKVPNMHGGSL